MGHPRISSEGTGRGVEEALAALVTSSAFPAINLDFVPPNSASFDSRGSAARASGPAPGGRPRSAAPARLSRRGKEGGGAERAAQPVRASHRVDSRRLRGPRDRPSPAGRLRGPAVGRASPPAPSSGPSRARHAAGNNSRPQLPPCSSRPRPPAPLPSRRAPLPRGGPPPRTPKGTGRSLTNIPTALFTISAPHPNGAPPPNRRDGAPGGHKGSGRDSTSPRHSS